jgi:hypothetical protein
MNPMVRVALKYGLIGSVLLVVPFLVLEYVMGAPLSGGSSILIDAILLLIFIFFAIKDFRDNFNQKILHFWQGMNIGFMVYGIMALTYAIFVLVYVNWQGEAFLNDHVAQAAEQMKATAERYPDTISEKQLQQGLTDLKNISALDLATKAFVGDLFVGFILTVVVSMILRKKPAGQ